MTIGRSFVTLGIAGVVTATQMEFEGVSKIPTALQAAAMAKQIFHDQSHGTLMVRSPPKVFGEGFADFPYGQVELIAQDCESRNDVLVFSSPMELTRNSWDHYHNNVGLHIRNGTNDWTEDPLLQKRFTLQGHMEKLPTKQEDPVAYNQTATCFFAKNPDAKAWENMSSHQFEFFKLVPQKIHYVGGFGNTHYIGFIDPKVWNAAPDSKKCSVWPKCAAEGYADDENCCPFDDDNAMRSCCVVDVEERKKEKSDMIWS